MRTVKPYGDTLNDGVVQLSFSLPAAAGPQAREAARLLAGQMGLEEAHVAAMEALGQGLSFFVVYGRCRHAVDLDAVSVSRPWVRAMTRAETDEFIRTRLGRPLKVVGACIETDAHTVGIDAIMNMKGFRGHKGLESYREMVTLNLGAQVSCEEAAAAARGFGADALLVSQVVTQKDIHVRKLTRLADLLEAEGLRERLTLVVGGPRITHQLAKELGYDAGFGAGTIPEQVAAYLAQEVVRRLEEQNGKGETADGTGHDQGQDE